VNFIHTTYTKILKPFLFYFTEPEQIHDFVLKFGHFLGRFKLMQALTRMLFVYKHPSLEQTIKKLHFINPVGLSAGFDKDADLVNILPSLGFGFSQIGTVTSYPYKGNPRPRLYRLPRSKSIVVNYGLKNIGVDAIVEKIRSARCDKQIISISVGRTNSKKTANIDTGIDDVYACLNKIIRSDIGSFYTINISCPNLFGGESFTTPESLQRLLKKLYTLPITKPVFIKMPSNLPWEEFEKLLQVIISFKVDGVIIANLSKDRNNPAIVDSIPSHVKGSISGLPMQEISNNLIRETYKVYGKELVIIGVGGIFSAKDAYAKIKNGASLVQVITGLIYEGPQIVGQINKDLVKLLRQDGYSNISEAIGSAHAK